MPDTDYLLLIAAMGLVTYIPRWLPLFFLSQRRLPLWFVEWLDLIPVAILSSLVFSDLFVMGSPRHLDILQMKSIVAVPTFIIALRTKSLGWTVIAGMVLFWVAEKLIGS
ncbi:MAG TPA: AzlD domain-containing protein [Methanotrichaceae archaeon]|nr:AzlD domain-containing protein [Methanotrichaceae archaeon]